MPPKNSPVKVTRLKAPKKENEKIKAVEGDSVKITVIKSQTHTGIIIEDHQDYSFIVGSYEHFKIKGLHHGIEGMCLGEQCKIICPLGYGYPIAMLPEDIRPDLDDLTDIKHNNDESDSDNENNNDDDNNNKRKLTKDDLKETHFEVFLKSVEHENQNTCCPCCIIL